MKLIIQIPCYNEEATLAVTVGDLPRRIEGIDEVEVLVIDDGSSDRTLEVAKASGIDHIVRLNSHRGLAAAFRAGLDACLRKGADIVVNTDADHSFRGEDVPRLIEPILMAEADLVIGVRSTNDADHFSRFKRGLHWLGSWAVSHLAQLPISDPTSGFRAYNREAAMRLNILSTYTYVLESIIQAAKKGLRIAQIPIRPNKPLRASRLIKNTPHYILRSMMTLLRVYVRYEPLRFFLTVGAIFIVGGIAASEQYVHAFFSQPGPEAGMSLFLAGGLLFLGFQFCSLGFIGDLIAGNRRMVEEALYRLKSMEGRQRHEEPADRLIVMNERASETRDGQRWRGAARARASRR